jgi:hypothetical protein
VLMEREGHSISRAYMLRGVKMKTTRLHINNNRLYIETHNHDSNGYYLGQPIVDIKTIKNAVADLPENYPYPYKNKRSYIQAMLREQKLLK